MVIDLELDFILGFGGSGHVKHEALQEIGCI